MSQSHLRIAMDATPIITAQTGAARYVAALSAALERHSVDVRRFAIGRAPIPAPPDVRRVRVPLRLVQRWWRTVSWPPADRLIGLADVVHATGLTVPPTSAPLVVTVHDIAALDYPNLHPPRQVREVATQVASLDRAAVVVASSEVTADRLIARGVDRDRIIVVPLGLTTLPEAPPAGTDDQPVRGSYLLAVGETSSRKGYKTLLRALARTGADGPLLVMAGPAGGDETSILRDIGALQLQERVVRLGPVDDSVLAGLYRGALALCFPSIAEGFGLPVLEALGAGVPVIASDLPALREVGGDAALFVPVGNEEALARALDAVASDSRLRTRLAVAGRDRARAFTWDRTAEATIGAYRLALATVG
jgi:glycosyltransferase involved in cell wall biosynthesis